jgi:hypothetical protein
LCATVVSVRPLPGVRAGSGLAWLGERLAVIQDDAPAVALVDPASGRVESRKLPGGGWDKATKLDLEACVSDGERLFAFGSGSTPRREQIAIVDEAGARVVEAPAFYAALRDAADFAGSELNVEGAVLSGGTLRLFQRGNGAPREGREPVDATGDVEWPALLGHLQTGSIPPRVSNVVRYDLGRIDGVRLTFTDAAGDFFLAVAEDSPDTYRDGPVVGAALGRIGDAGARWARLVDREGKPFVAKAEGLAVRGDDAWVVIDRDDPGVPADLCRVEIRDRT